MRLLGVYDAFAFVHFHRINFRFYYPKEFVVQKK